MYNVIISQLIFGPKIFLLAIDILITSYATLESLTSDIPDSNYGYTKLLNTKKIHAHIQGSTSTCVLCTNMYM